MTTHPVLYFGVKKNSKSTAKPNEKTRVSAQIQQQLNRLLAGSNASIKGPEFLTEDCFAPSGELSTVAANIHGPAVAYSPQAYVDKYTENGKPMWVENLAKGRTTEHLKKILTNLRELSTDSETAKPGEPKKKKPEVLSAFKARKSNAQRSVDDCEKLGKRIGEMHCAHTSTSDPKGITETKTTHVGRIKKLIDNYIAKMKLPEDINHIDVSCPDGDLFYINVSKPGDLVTETEHTALLKAQPQYFSHGKKYYH